MKLSKANIRIEKIEDDIETVELFERAGFLKQVSTGSYVYLHLMQMIINNINNIIKSEMNNSSALEVGLTQIQSSELWKQTGRYESYGDEMYKIKDRKGRELILSGTNEELITSVVSQLVTSYKDLNFTWYQINNKFRDEIRTNNGLMRCKEFYMLDAYSFHDKKENLQNEYQNMRDTFCRIFDRLELKYEIEKADSGEIGGSISEEFVVNGVEVAHIFQLDDKYTSSLNCKYVDENNQKKNVLMGCYGIGITRLIQVIAESKRDKKFINWGKEISSYEYGIVIADIRNEEQIKEATALYERLKRSGKRVYLDDRNVKMGMKLYEIDIIGTYNKIIVGRKVNEGIVEIKNYSDWKEIKINDIA